MHSNENSNGPLGPYIVGATPSRNWDLPAAVALITGFFLGLKYVGAIWGWWGWLLVAAPSIVLLPYVVIIVGRLIQWIFSVLADVFERIGRGD